MSFLDRVTENWNSHIGANIRLKGKCFSTCFTPQNRRVAACKVCWSSSRTGRRGSNIWICWTKRRDFKKQEEDQIYDGHVGGPKTSCSRTWQLPSTQNLSFRKMLMNEWCTAGTAQWSQHRKRNANVTFKRLVYKRVKAHGCCFLKCVEFSSLIKKDVHVYSWRFIQHS